MVGAISPVGDRRVEIDADRVDRRVRPQRIEREAHLGATVAHMGAVFGPIGRVGDLRRRAEHGAHVGGKRAELRDRRIDAGCGAHARQPHELAADDEAVDAVGGLREMRVVQDVPAEAPLGGAGIRNRPACDREVAGRRRAEERLDLRCRRSARVDRADAPRRRVAGDAPAPGIGRLTRRARPRVRHRVVRRDVHHHEWIQDHFEAAVLQVPDQPHHAGVRRGAPISRGRARLRDDARARPRQSRGRPLGTLRHLGGALDARRDRAMAGAQIVAEPAHDKRHAPEVRAQRLQRVERRDHVGGGRQLMPVLGPRHAEAEGLHDGRGLVAELARARDQAHGADHPGQAVDRASNLEGELRHAVSEALQRQALEDHIGEAAIGGRVVGALLRDDERVRRLRLVAAMDAHRQRGQVELAPIRPHPPHEADRALAQADREVGEVGIGGAHGLAAAADALAATTARALDRRRRDLLEPRRPDQLPADACAAVDARDRRAFGRGESVELGQPRPFDEARAVAIDERAVDERARRSAEHAADGAADRPAERAAGGRTNGGEEEGGHGYIPRACVTSRGGRGRDDGEAGVRVRGYALTGEGAPLTRSRRPAQLDLSLRERVRGSLLPAIAMT